MSLLLSTLVARGIYGSVPPDPHTRVQDNSTLLVSWWCTVFSFAIILVRVVGRHVRMNRLFTEDKVMIASVFPLFVRMAFVHVVLIWGTNNTKTSTLTELDIQHREIGSRLVLASRIFYATYIWMAKYTVCEFVRRLTGMVWTKTFQVALRCVEYFLASTLVAVIVATLTECQPFSHYWQVVPDPGPQCRLGYANLMTMGVCDILTDFFLVALPISLFLTSAMSVKRKIGLTILFASSLILIAITGFRVPSVIKRDGLQSYRSLLASLEILAATAVSNFVVIGSFIRDRGLKKAKFKRPEGSLSVSESVDQNSVRRTTLTQHQWGSDADLVSGLGIRLHPELHATETNVIRPAPVAMVSGPGLHPGWTFDGGQRKDRTGSISNTTTQGIMKTKSHGLESTGSVSPKASPRRVSFYDVGGLLSDSAPSPPMSNNPVRGALSHASSGYFSQSHTSAAPHYTQFDQRSQPQWQPAGDHLPSPSTSYTGNSPTSTLPPSHPVIHDQESPPYRLRESDDDPHFLNLPLHDPGGLLSDTDGGRRR
ncbi:hypothetical protein BGW36DRAFT_294803 [Talaromyces proteolyticus]|uniref:Rhodopsin domain-containing protein n=1 Tax=Talaromyces proteolyticus TaxID=1131652 RepID=A0AAD4Q215_9EURO|nr:uncharacterized protein BGW36DRAFT_294803 [Talaromyces proteolyticus]KAH8699090.1 hypothetical protein BGW36DRAFT_294803 [Talaromyces proteolyticus]